MTDPLRPASTQVDPRLLSTPTGAPAVQRSPVPDAASGRPDRVQLSTSAPGTVDTGAGESRVAVGLAERVVSGLRQADAALGRLEALWRGGPPTPAAVQPHALQVLEAAGAQHFGVAPLDTDQVLKVGEQRVQGYQLVGSEGRPLVPFAALMTDSGSAAELAVARENVGWALSRAQQELEGLDRQRLEAAQQAAQQAGAGRPLVPTLDSGVAPHLPLSPQRVVELLA